MRKILIALDSVGIDPQGYDRPHSVYSGSRFLFPPGRSGSPIEVNACGRPGMLVETDVIGGQKHGAIECAITYASIFSGRSAAQEHGLMRGLGLKDRLLERLVSEDNLFRRFSSPCLANAIFPAHLEVFGTSYVQHLVPRFSRAAMEEALRFHGQPIGLRGREKNGFAELFTLAEINQNIFVFAALDARVPLRTWEDVRRDAALTSSMTHELEGEFDVLFVRQDTLSPRTPERAGQILAELSREHDFTFYKYQIPDLVSHTGRIDAARDVFAVIERFMAAVLAEVAADTVVIVTSDHGHLEQLSSSRGHPKSRVPTWYFGPEPGRAASRLTRPEGIFDVLTTGR